MFSISGIDQDKTSIYPGAELFFGLERVIFKQHCKAARWLLEANLVVLNHDKVTRTTSLSKLPHHTHKKTLETRQTSRALSFSARRVFSATRGFLATDIGILNHGQVTRTTPVLAPSFPNYHTTPTRGRLSSLQIKRASLPYTVSLWWYWTPTGDKPATTQYLDHSDTAATSFDGI
ncbi:hypothetical protein TNCV_4786101 [Trichonephila clavipes]|nr:hypothetical protein TNCV_4786101 [Trichonephila clavipes]